jgi:hypothetical protein
MDPYYQGVIYKLVGPSRRHLVRIAPSPLGGRRLRLPTPYVREQPCVGVLITWHTASGRNDSLLGHVEPLLNEVSMSDDQRRHLDQLVREARRSPLRLRVGVFLILLWIVPFWALAPGIAVSQWTQ